MFPHLMRDRIRTSLSYHFINDKVCSHAVPGQAGEQELLLFHT